MLTTSVPRLVLRTGREKSEDSSLESQFDSALLRRLLGCCADAIVLTDLEGRIREILTGENLLAELLPYEGSLPDNIVDILGVKAEAWRGLAASGANGDAELSLADRNGGERLLTVKASRVPERPDRLLFVLHDTTRYRRELDRQQHHYELILNSAGDGIFVLNNDEQVSFVNPAAARMVGRPVQDIIGKNHHELIHHSYSNGSPYPRERCPISDTLMAGTSHRVKGEFFWRADGSAFPVEYFSTPILDNGIIEGAVVIYKDISEQLRSQNALKVTNDILHIERETLEEKNTALKEILHQIDQEKRQMAAQIQANIDRVVIPLVTNIGDKLSAADGGILEALKKSLSDIADPFVKKVDKQYAKLTPRELEICNLIKNGLNCKAVASTLGVSTTTVLKQRQQIRKKLKISRKKVNLHAHLKSI